MKKIFSKLILLIFVISLSLFVTLIAVVLVMGPKETEDSIKALFTADNYIQEYTAFNKNIGKAYIAETSSNQSTNTLGVYIQKNIQIDPPLLVPSAGIAPRANFLFTGNLKDGGHEGIDIWTNTQGTGIDTSSYGKGNPVYSSCTGYVRTVWEENGDVSVICDRLDEIYKNIVPSLEIKVLYGHMADQFSDQVYIYVKEGQRIQKGDIIGYQGNRCYWAPQNRIVHLHYGIYDIREPMQIPLNPEPYIGVSCTTLNQQFSVVNTI